MIGSYYAAEWIRKRNVRRAAAANPLPVHGGNGASPAAGSNGNGAGPRREELVGTRSRE